MPPEKFELARATDLQPDLATPDGKNTRAKKAALRRVVSNLTVSNPEMLTLFPEIVHCMKSTDADIKRMCFLYLETYAKSRPQQAADALLQLKNEVNNYKASPITRAIALRTMSSVPTKIYAKAALEAIPDCLRCSDPYLRKTACFAAAKVWVVASEYMHETNVLEHINQMLAHENSPVVAAAAAQSLLAITETSHHMEFVIDFPTSLRLAHMLSDCPEFSQVSILKALCQFVPQTHEEAEKVADCIVPGLRHTNAAVAMGTTRALLMLSHYSPILHHVVLEQIFAPLLSQLNRPPEIQYVVLRNILLILQLIDQETLIKLRIPPQAFFCRASDVSYIRSTKIDILAALCTLKNCETIIPEILEFTKVNDTESKRKAIGLLASVGMRIEKVAPLCVRELKRFIPSEPQSVTSLVRLIRRYPKSSLVVDSLDSIWELDQIPEDEDARQSYIWLIGAYYTDGGHATKLLCELADNFASEPLSVQYALFTACVKVFLRFPQASQGKLVPNIFEIAADSSSNPDIRERALIYWRILSYSPIKMASIINHPLPAILKEIKQDLNHLEDLELSLGYLSSIYMKPSDQLFKLSHTRQLKPSKALLPREIRPDDEGDSTVHLDNVPQMISSPAAVTQPSMQTHGYFGQASPNTPTSPTAHISHKNDNGLGYFGSQSSQQTGTAQWSAQNPPPVPRHRNTEPASLEAQFSGINLNSPLVEDHSERLIDI